MGFYNKIKWVLGILLVFIVIVTTNLIDRNNFVRIRDSVVSIYEDRLVAKDLILKMMKSIHQKEIAVLVLDAGFFQQRNQEVNTNLQLLISRFEITKLTKEEGLVLNNLKRNLELLREAESKFVDAGLSDETQVIGHINTIKENLNDLSKIQIKEGNRQMALGKRAVDTVELFTRIEIYLLIFLAVVIQIIVMYKPKEES